MPICDKCGCPVSPDNDSVLVEAFAAQAPAVIYGAQSRHFLPVIGEDGKVLCPGSPSRAQYIEGQPKDTRPEWPYNPEMEPIWRKAHRQLLHNVQPGKLGAGVA